MYPTFTGSARSRRQVNLSGRTSNPFAAYGAPKPSTTVQTAHNPVAHAQQERFLREQERRRPPAATKIQRTWRGHTSRRRCQSQWRQQWDAFENQEGPVSHVRPYATGQETLQQLRLLAQFATSRSQEDIRRMLHYAKRYTGSESKTDPLVKKGWTYPAFRLARVIVRVLGAPGVEKRLSILDIRDLSNLLAELVTISGDLLANHSMEYYQAIKTLPYNNLGQDCARNVVLALIRNAPHNGEAAYAGLAWIYLSRPELPGFINAVDLLAQSIEYHKLAAALVNILESKTNQQLLEKNADDSLLWLLSYFIYFHGHLKQQNGKRTPPDAQYVQVVSRFIQLLADDIGKRIDNFDMHSLSGNVTSQNGLSTTVTKTLPDFVRSQVLSLVNQENVSGLLAKLELDASTSSSRIKSSSEASALASYVLTLLRVFPRRRNDIQLWLYWGSVIDPAKSQRKVPAAKYLYEAVKSTSIYSSISRDPEETIRFLAPAIAANEDRTERTSQRESRDKEWRIILLFLELYSFILQVMDDEEFRSGKDNPDPSASWTKQSALPIPEILSLSVFLKNLAFALYWYGPEMAGQQEQKTLQGLAAYFGKGQFDLGNDDDYSSARVDDREIAGISGMTVAVLKGLVVGALRMVYEREYVFSYRVIVRVLLTYLVLAGNSRRKTIG